MTPMYGPACRPAAHETMPKRAKFLFRRRGLLLGIFLASMARLASAQQGRKVYRLTYVSAATPVEEVRSGAFRYFIEEMQRLSYTEGQNLLLEFYSGQGNREKYAELAREAVQSHPDVIVAASGPMIRHLQSATHSIPIAGIIGDPIAFGVATNLSRPGGNVTGVSVDVGGLDVWGKRLALLKEAIPKLLNKVGYLTPRTAWDGPDAAAMREAAQRLDISLVGVLLGENVQETEYQRVFATIPDERLDGLVVSYSVENFAHRKLIAELTERTRLPTIYPWRESVEAGGLMAYAYDLRDLWRQLARQIDQIFKGANPGEIPFYQATKFELIINVTAAKKIGVEIPGSLLLRADEVIE